MKMEYDKEEVQAVYRAVVGDKVGLDNAGDFEKVLQAVGVGQGGEAGFGEADVDGDGLVGLEELLFFLETTKCAEGWGGEAPKEDITNTFIAFGGSADLSGSVKLASINSVLDEFEITFPTPVPSCTHPIDLTFNQFRAVFGHTLTHPHFTPLTFCDDI